MSTKRCCTCGEARPLAEFNKRARSKDGLQARCSQCFKLWHQANRESHNKQIHARSRRVRAELRELIRQYLLEHPCVDCGCDDIRVLEFDHVGEKVKDISRMVRLVRTWDTITAEIEKCEVRCSNCHQLRTYERAGAARALWM